MEEGERDSENLLEKARRAFDVLAESEANNARARVWLKEVRFLAKLKLGGRRGGSRSRTHRLNQSEPKVVRKPADAPSAPGRHKPIQSTDQFEGKLDFIRTVNQARPEARRHSRNGRASWALLATVMIDNHHLGSLSAFKNLLRDLWPDLRELGPDAAWPEELAYRPPHADQHQPDQAGRSGFGHPLAAVLTTGLMYAVVDYMDGDARGKVMVVHALLGGLVEIVRHHRF